MILIAVGLTTAVIVGIPVLMFAIDTLSATSQLEVATEFAERVHNSTALVDTEETSEVLTQINVPVGVTVTAEGTTLTISLEQGGSVVQTWSETYNHTISLTAPQQTGPHIMRITIVDESIRVSFSVFE